MIEQDSNNEISNVQKELNDIQAEDIEVQTKILYMVSELEASLSHKFERLVKQGPLSILFKLLENEYHQAATALLPDVKEQVDLFKEDIQELTHVFGEKLLSDNSPISDYFVEKLAEYFSESLSKSMRQNYEKIKDGNESQTQPPIEETNPVEELPPTEEVEGKKDSNE